MSQTVERVFVDDYSAVYDLLHQSKNYEQEAHWIHELVSNFCQPPASLLELGCGTGKHARELNRLGYYITGIDQSESMLAACNQTDRFKACQADMRDFELDIEFDAAISLFHCVGYLIENNDLISCFKSVGKHLRPGAVFVFDGWFAPAVLSQPLLSRTRTVSANDIEIERTSFTTLDVERSIATVRFEFMQRKNGEVKEYTEVHQMRYFSIPEIELLAQLAGLKLISYMPFGRHDQLGVNDFNFLAVLQKPHAQA